MADSAGNLVQAVDYYPFGQERLCGGPGGASCDAEKKYIGEYYDVDTALNYLNARYYDSSIGRFISQDPMFWSPEKFLTDPQQMNSYNYARNNPIVNKDPSGEIVDIVLDVGFIAYDLYDLGRAYLAGEDTKEQWIYLGLDTTGAVIPFVTGLGLAARTAKVAKETAKIVEAEKLARAARLAKIYEKTNEAGRVLMEGVENEKILNLIKDNYKIGAKVGDGSTAMAIKYTAETGKLVGNSDHIIKGQQTLNTINNIKRTEKGLNQQEIKVLNKIGNDIEDALNKAGK